LIRYILEEGVLLECIEGSVILSNAKLGVVVYGNKSTYDVAALLNTEICLEEIIERLQGQYKGRKQDEIQAGVEFTLKWLTEHRLVRICKAMKQSLRIEVDSYGM